MKVLWPHLAQLHCRKCGTVVRREPPQVVWESLQAMTAHSADPVEATLTFDLPCPKRCLRPSSSTFGRQGFRRLLFGNDVVRIEDATAGRFSRHADGRGGSSSACDFEPQSICRSLRECISLRGGRVAVRIGTQVHRFSQGFHCARCDLDYSEPSRRCSRSTTLSVPAPPARGLDEVIGIDLDLAVPDRTKALAEGVVKPWQTGMSAECQQDLLRAARKPRFPSTWPFRTSEEHQRWVLEGDPGYVPDDPDHSLAEALVRGSRLLPLAGIQGIQDARPGPVVPLPKLKTCPDCRGNRFQSGFPAVSTPAGAGAGLLCPAGRRSAGSPDALSCRPTPRPPIPGGTPRAIQHQPGGTNQCGPGAFPCPSFMRCRFATPIPGYFTAHGTAFRENRSLWARTSGGPEPPRIPRRGWPRLSQCSIARPEL